MHKYVVRLLNYRGSIIDGEVFTAKNEQEALQKYKNRCFNLGIKKCAYDTYFIEKWEYNF